MSSRLRKLQNKDYSQIVEFPVEIVGRDNLVRRYSYDDAVRLYYRRIHSAGVRYDDPEMIDAEIRHCRNRIVQLRRSFLEYTGWAWVVQSPVPGVLGSPYAAEVAAFLRRAFADDPAMGAAVPTVIESGPGDVCFLRAPRGDRTYLLYLWRLDDAAPPGARADYLRTRERLQANADVGSERLFASHEGPEVAILLTGEGEWDGVVLEVEASLSVPLLDAPPADPWRDATRALHDGDLGEALRRFEAAMEEWPTRRVLTQSAAILALLNREPERAEFAARYGRLQAPRDPLLAFCFATACVRRGRAAEADAVLRELPPSPEPSRAPLAVLAGCLAATRFRPLRAWRAFGYARSPVAPSYLVEAAAAARLGLLSAMLGLASALVALVPTVLLAEQHDPVAIASGLTGGLGAAVAAWWWRRFRNALSGARYDTIRLVSPELLPRDAETDARN